MNTTVYFATSNEGKVRNAQKALEPFGIEVVRTPIELVESRAEDPADIALEKARQAFRELGHPVLVEDSGFFILALNGFPMTHVKFSLKTIGVDGVLKLLDGVEDRRAQWRMTLAYVWGEDQYESFTFVEDGIIAVAPRPVKRTMMSDYWKIYIPTVLATNTKALSEMEEQDLVAWQDFYAKNNQFQMFGRWFADHKEA